jgi:hypothetical protein
MARKQTTASQRQLLERTLSDLAALITDMAPQAQVEMTFEQYEDEDAHVYVHPVCPENLKLFINLTFFDSLFMLT